MTANEGRLLGLSLRSPAFHRVRPGVYVDNSQWTALAPWQKYQVRVHAFVRVHPGAVLCLESAAVVHGAPSFGNTRDIHVYDSSRSTSRRFGDVFVHAWSEPRTVDVVAGVPVTSLLDTVVDLARVLPLVQSLAIADAAVAPAQGGSLTLPMLREHAVEQSSTRGREKMRWVWAHADPRSESPGETFSRAGILWSGFEHPELQEEFHYEGFEDRADFCFRSMRGLGESDGWGKYDLSDPETAARNLAREKRREDRLRRHGHPFARWDAKDAYRVAPMCRALQLSGVPIVRPAESAMLANFRRAPRLLGP